MIKSCNCKHEGQDKLNGKQKRVFNKTTKGDRDNPELRCTVCGRTTGNRPGF